ncbi:hypothetical protein DFH06DRAFT_1044524 [Mycena polygramma]|nr:hypothetical protein DFH06DRAFT_1044524 [Mycena polygramma]
MSPAKHYDFVIPDELAAQTSRLRLTESSGSGSSNTCFVETLPPEIIAEIFVNFLPKFPEFAPCSGILSPLILCRICRYWREVALSTPALWKSISIAIDESDPHEAEKLELFKTWIARSGNCPLSINLVGSESPVLPQFIETAVVHCPRWEQLEVLLPFDYLHLVQGEMPLLQKLVFGPIELRHDVESPLTLFDHAPQLRRVLLTERFLNATVLLPWAQFTHLEAQCLYEHECTEILRDAQCLVVCRLSVCCSDDDVSFVPDVPPHTQLRDLVLLSAHPRVKLWMILDYLTLPALRTLQVPERCIKVPRLAMLIRRSECTMEELRVTDAGQLPESEYRAFLPSVGMITLELTPTVP